MLWKQFGIPPRTCPLESGRKGARRHEDPLLGSLSRGFWMMPFPWPLGRTKAAARSVQELTEGSAKPAMAMKTSDVCLP